jgi:hypothetical protein
VVSCGPSSLNHNPSQVHLISLGIFGGIFGACCSEILLAILTGSEQPMSVSDRVRARQNSGLKILSSVVSGLLLPRIAFNLDASNLTTWNYLATLSSEASF